MWQSRELRETQPGTRGAFKKVELTEQGLVTVCLFAAIGAAGAFMPAAADTYWHLRAGRELWQTGRVPLSDAYSHTAFGRAWPNHEWLWQAISYPIHVLGGFPLLTLFGMLLVLAAYVLVYRLMRGSAGLRFALVALSLPVATAVWSLRPQLVTLLGTIALATLLARERFRYVPLLFLIWSNFHGAVALGGGMLAAVTLSAALFDRDKLGRLLVVLVASAAATLITPMGTQLIRFISESIGRSTGAGIEEWQPIWIWTPQSVGFLLLVLGLGVAASRGYRRLEGWPDRVLAASCLVLLPLALRYTRNLGPFLLVALPLASRLLAPPGSASERAARDSGDARTQNAAIAGVVIGTLLLAVALAWSRPLERLGWRPIEPAALGALASCDGPLYNRYNDGGYLIWLAPERKVFIDSRQDPYPDEFVAAYAGTEASGVGSAALAAEGVRCAFLPPSSRSVATLARGGWRELYRSERWIVLAAR